MTPRIARLLIVTGALALPLGLLACGSEESSSSSPGSSEQAEGTTGTNSSEGTSEDAEESEESEEASRGRAGQRGHRRAGRAAEDGCGRGGGHRGPARAPTDDVDAMFEKWATFEGTVKQNEVDLYLTMEDSLADLRSAVEDGDGPRRPPRWLRCPRPPPPTWPSTRDP